TAAGRFCRCLGNPSARALGRRTSHQPLGALLILLRSVFERLKKRATLMHNPFENIPLLKHYFKPGREEMRRILTEKMPQLFSRTDAANAEDEKKAPATSLGIKALIESMTAENWAEV